MKPQETTESLYALMSPTSGRPSDLMSDGEWQQKFQRMRDLAAPHKKRSLGMYGRYSRESGGWNEEARGTYRGMTNWQSYCQFINDALSLIRSGQIVRCWFSYQIWDLLKFEHDRLRTRYDRKNREWTVWLENDPIQESDSESQSTAKRRRKK